MQEKVPLSCKTMVMYPNGSTVAVSQGEGRFFHRFLAKLCVLTFFAVFSVKNRHSQKKTSLALQNVDWPVMVHNRRFAR